MQSNYFDNMILGTNTIGQGTISVEGTHRTTLRILIAKFARLISLRASWRRQLRTLAGSFAKREMTPAYATCPSSRASRCQRQKRWMPGVVVDPGTVGIG